jgi:riboflavin biosynthesis pyrimidine reductase
MTPTQMISEISNNFPPQDSKAGIRLLVEAGPKLLQQMINDSLIDQLYLSINLEKTGDNQISIDDLTSTFKLTSSETVSACEFRYYQKLAN